MKLYKKRRQEYKTNYSKRLKLLRGNHNRLVVRKTNKFIILEIIESKDSQVKIIYYVNTKELLTAYIQQTHKLVQYENELENIVDSIIDT